MSFHEKPKMDIQFDREELQILRDALREFRFGDHRLSRTDDRYKLQQRIEKCIWYSEPPKQLTATQILFLQKGDKNA